MPLPEPLPPGVQIPVTFHAGATLTELDLNTLQQLLLQRILSHTHSGGTNGVQLNRDALVDRAVGTNQIDLGAVTTDRLHAGAVGADQLAAGAVHDAHLAASAVLTAAIKNDQVTLEKLSPDIRALLTRPTMGATTYAYVVYLDGPIIFPPPADGNWYDWLTRADAQKPSWQWDMTRLRDDGMLQAIDYLRNPKYLDRRRVVRLPPKEEIVGGGDTPRVVTATGAAPDAPAARIQQTMTELVREIGPENAATGLTSELAERKRVTLQLDLQQTRVGGAAAGTLMLNPGIGSNNAFTPHNRSVQFAKGVMPNEEGKQTIQNIFDAYDIPLKAHDEQVLAVALSNQSFIDFVNGPWLVPIGYWTASSRNVNAVIRQVTKSPQRVRITFATPYKEANYSVTITPDAPANLAQLRVPVVLTRAREYVEIAFAPDATANSKANFSIAIFGELQGAQP